MMPVCRPVFIPRPVPRAVMPKTPTAKTFTTPKTPVKMPVMRKESSKNPIVFPYKPIVPTWLLMRKTGTESVMLAEKPEGNTVPPDFGSTIFGIFFVISLVYFVIFERW